MTVATARPTAARLTIASPVGPLTVAAEDDAIVGLDYADGGGHDRNPLLDEAERQLDAYFAGRLKVFDLPIRLVGSPFQKRVWAAMTGIGWGEIASYGGLAVGLGTGPRAVGNACGRNPISIIVPCHRVVGGGGAIGGYGSAGLSIKRWLLRHEGRPIPG